MADEQQEKALGFYDKLGIAFLQVPLDCLRQFNERISRLETSYFDLAPDERRALFLSAKSALENLTTTARSIAGYRGLLESFEAQMETIRTGLKTVKTPHERVELLRSWSRLVQEILLASDVLLYPKQSADDIYQMALEGILVDSTPLYNDEEHKNMARGKFNKLVRKRYDKITQMPEAPEDEAEVEEDG